MLAIVADMRRDIDGFLKLGRFKEADREGVLRFYTSSWIPNVVAAAGGFDENAASQSVAGLVSRFDPRIVVSAGFASAGKPDLQTGDIVVCNRVLMPEGPAYSWRASNSLEIETNSALIEEIRGWLDVADVSFEIGGCVAPPQFITKTPMKEWLGKTFDALAIDVDSYYVAEAVQATRRPCIPVKVVVDSMKREVPSPIFHALRCPMPKRFARATRYAASNPTGVFHAVKLAANARKARKSLAQFLHRLTRTRVAMEQS